LNNRFLSDYGLSRYATTGGRNNPEYEKWYRSAERYCREEAGLPTGIAPTVVDASDPENTLLILTTAGLVKIVLLSQGAPQHVENIKRFAREKYYDNRPFALSDLSEAGFQIHIRQKKRRAAGWHGPRASRRWAGGSENHLPTTGVRLTRRDTG
jgi:hypothetical protein